MSGVKWEEPSGGSRKWGRWDLIRDELKTRPGEWALVREDYSTGARTHLKNKFPELEVTFREIKNGRGKMYARYVGKKEDDK